MIIRRNCCSACSDLILIIHLNSMAASMSLRYIHLHTSRSSTIRNQVRGSSHQSVQLSVIPEDGEIDQNLRVGFLSDDSDFQGLVKQYCVEWSQYANVQFQFPAQGPYEITFDPGYQTTPTLVTGFNYIDIPNSNDTTLAAIVSNVTKGNMARNPTLMGQYSHKCSRYDLV